MYTLKILELFYILKLLTVCSLLVNLGEAKRYDVSDDEILVNKHYHYKNELKWMWSVNAFCRFECWRRYILLPKRTYVGKREILLEAVGCVKTEVEVLHCGCQLRRPGRYLKISFGTEYFINGLNGEYYELRRAYGVCDDRDTMRIYQRVAGTEDTSLQVPLLWGITRLSLAMNTQRIPLRQWHKDRDAGRIPNSSSDSEEK